MCVSHCPSELCARRREDVVRVSTRAPRFRENTPLMRAHETMVDLIKGNSPSSFMDILGVGIFGFMQNLEVDPDRDLIYSDDEEEDEDFNQNQSQKLKPHPQLKEIDDKEAEQIKLSLKRSKSVNQNLLRINARKCARKKKATRKGDKDQNASPEEEQGKSDSSEYEDVNEENIDYNYKVSDKSVPDLSNKLHTEDNNVKVVEEEKIVPLNIEKDKPPENINIEKSKPHINESVPEKKTKKKSKQIEKNKTTQNDTWKTETAAPVIDEYTKKSREMAAIGNRLAANGQYEMAIKCFTEAIKFNPKEYKIFGNRSFCFEKMQQYEEALSDAEISLLMEPNWIKGLFRKGKALCGLKKYYEASLAYRDVLKLDSTSQEATMELKRSQTLHLMEMGFSWTQCNNALKRHSSLEEAIEALFNGECDPTPEENGAYKLDVTQLSRADPSVQNEKKWENVVRLPSKMKPYPKENVQLPPPVIKRQGKPEVFPVWVGSLAPTVDYLTLQEVFNRAGKVFSIKMVLEHHCAFVNYTRKEDSAQAVQTLNGVVVEGVLCLCDIPVEFLQGSESPNTLRQTLTLPPV
ncbi:hypothetical protein WMY93_016727 [Mugilogobius chulae]|uniref:RRM domain-containing protein n=1 Tax=Mugilogobius chulae TaxID=88201 RepID=A0AAW0NWC7_9GOBI